METLNRKLEENKQTLLYSLAFTFFWGLFAHSYCFFEYSFTHDSLMELHGSIFGNDWKISLGRVFVPLYRDIFRSDATLPWMIGALSLIWTGFSVFLIEKILQTHSRLLMFLTAGILTTNISVSATAATYLHDLDCNMFSLMCAVAAVYCWKFCKWGIIPGAMLLACSIGLYQSFLSVTIIIVMFVCIMQLLDGDSFGRVFTNGLRAIVMILIGGILYLVSMKLIQALAGVQMLSDNYNSMNQLLKIKLDMIPQLVVQTYQDCINRLLNAPNAYPGILTKATLALLVLISGAALIVGLTNKPSGIWETLLCILLVILMPLGMNMIYLLMQGNIHDLMVYPIWIAYLFAFRLCQRLVEWIDQKAWCKKYPFHRWGGMVVAFLIALILYGNVQFANGMYLKKDLEKDAYFSYMTRVIDHVESREEYEPGVTPLCFVGKPENLYSMPTGFKEYAVAIGMASSDVILVHSQERYENLFGYLIGFPAVLADAETWDMLEEAEEVAQMPCYPDQDSIRMIGDVLVVKLGD